ncbi:MAG: cytochrome oxidase assembly family protein/cell division protein FtsY [Pseudomonadota bacterium]|jgi:fused signal recognition particle receptor
MFRITVLLALLLTLVSLLLGADIRLSDVAMGCPEWPGCYGVLLPDEPLQALRHAVDAKTAARTPDHQWLSDMYAYGMAALGALTVLALLQYPLLVWRREGGQGGLALLLAVMLTSVLAWNVTWSPDVQLIPLVASLRLLGALLLLALWQWIYLRRRHAGPVEWRAGVMLRWMVYISLPLFFLQLATGIWTSVQSAGLACQDFPACMGSYLPPEGHFFEAFDFWQGLDAELARGVLSPESRALIHWAHRLGALVVYIMLAWMGISLSSVSGAAALRKSGVVLSFLLLLQVALGMASVLMRLPVFVVLGHDVLAALLVLNLVYIRVVMFWSPSVASVTAAADAPLPPVVSPVGVYDRLRQQLGKTRRGFAALWGGGHDETLEALEEQLLMADVGVQVTREILATLRDRVEMGKPDTGEKLREALKSHLSDILEPCSAPLHIPETTRPFVILVVGVNGVGKTTTIGKLAKRLQLQGHSVMLAAGDTFRAAAVEQLQTWGERNQIPVIAQQSGSDSASVIFDAVQAAQARGVDVLIADTAGRLQNKSHLMDELSKIKRIMARLDPAAPHEVLLVLDAGTGQNALSQAQLFNDAVQLTGMALTKLDGTARGGVIFALARQCGIPIRFIGIGEGIDDLRDFDAGQFIEALFATEGEAALRESGDA